MQTRRNVGTRERWLSLLGGGVSLAEGLRRRDAAGGLLALLGGFLLFRGLSGHCPVYGRLHRSTSRPEDSGLLGEHLIQARSRIVVRRPREVVYRYWRDLDNLPQAMRHIHAIEVRGNRSRWTARTALGRRLQWESQITQDSPNERLAWRSVAGSQVDSMGEVRFRPHLNGGTEVDVNLYYRPPGGAVGRLLATVLGGLSEKLVHRDLERFKAFIESGTMDAQAHAGGRTS
jgi:uncharacterized membrane protein